MVPGRGSPGSGKPHVVLALMAPSLLCPRHTCARLYHMAAREKRGTNIRLPEATVRRAKAAAAMAGVSLSQWVEDLIASALKAGKPTQ